MATIFNASMDLYRPGSCAETWRNRPEGIHFSGGYGPPPAGTLSQAIQSIEDIWASSWGREHIKAVVSIREECEKCSGIGYINKRFRYGFKRSKCPDCKGINSVVEHVQALVLQR